MIATAGTVNTGAIDDLPALAALAREEDLWLHVDGCIGALIAIAPQNAYRVAGIEKADSLALDPHKWLHAPFEAGCALVRDASAHRNAFAVTPEYLDVDSARPRVRTSGCTTGACRPRADFARSRSGWRSRSTASKNSDA